MPGEYSWYVQGRVIYARIFGVVTVEDLRDGNNTISDLLSEAQALPVHVIYDAANIERIAFNVAQVMKTLTYMRHAKLGWVTVFGTKDSLGMIVQFFGSMMMRLVGARIRTFNTRDETLSFLRREDPTLSGLDDDTGQPP